MDVSAILAIILPIIEQLPTIEAGVAALVKAIKGMLATLNPVDVLSAVEQAIPAITNAIVANTK